MLRTDWLFRTICASLLLLPPRAGMAQRLAPAAVKTSLPARADLPEMSTDRPDYTESTDVVGKGVVQFENGFTFAREQGVHTFTGPELLLRAGFSERLELRLGGDGFLSQRAAGLQAERGYSDLEAGLKIKLLEERAGRPSLSLIPMFSAPVGTQSFSSGGYDPTLKAALAKELGKGFAASGNVNVSSLSSPAGRFVQTAFSASLGHELGRHFAAYTEIFGFTPWEKDGSPAWMVNSGVSRAMGRNVRVDIRAGKRITAAGPDWFWGVGMGVRMQPRELLR